ncbi:MAG TPA: hypothetical protein VGR45_06720 [Stellaceae bacterium]|nr:hypothetical protein [Stellaceae bacterium]
MRTQAQHIIERFGGLTPLADAAGCGNTVVQGWKERGFIPARRHPKILDAGRALDPPLEMREFFEDLAGVRHSVPARALSETSPPSEDAA